MILLTNNVPGASLLFNSACLLEILHPKDIVFNNNSNAVLNNIALDVVLEVA